MKIGIHDSWSKVFGLKPEEAPKFNYLFFHSFFMWFFISFYFVAANGVFITHFSSDYLPLAYIGAGAMGYVVTLFYSYLQKRVNPRYLFLGALSIMLIIPLLSRFGLGLIAPENEKWLSFFIFVWVWPFISLLGIESGGLALQFLNLRQVKRQFGMINIGGIISSILSYFLIPLIMPFLSHPFDLLYIGIVGVIIAIFIIIRLYTKFGSEKGRVVSSDTAESRVSFKDLAQDRYFVLIMLSAVFSMMIIYFVDFGYLSSIKVQSTLIKTAEDASNFISLMAGIVKSGEFLLSYFSNRILSKYGMRLGLTIMPFSLAFLVLLTSAIGLIEGPTSIAFFLLIVITKAAERILRRGLDDPSFNILYQPLPGKQKLEVQTKVGVVMQLSIGIAGFLLFVVSKILTTDAGFQLKYYPLMFLPIAVAWVFIARKLYLSYKGKLRQILADISRTQKRDALTFKYGSEFITRKFKQFNEKVVRLSVTLLSETDPRAIDRYAPGLLEKNDISITRSILKNIDPTSSRRLAGAISKILENDMPKSIIRLVTKALKTLDYSVINKLTPEEIPIFSQTMTDDEKLLLIKAMNKGVIEVRDEIIVEFLKDNRLIRNAAIKLAGRVNKPELNKLLVALVKAPEYSHIVSSILVESNKGVLEELDKYFDADVSNQVLLKVIEIYAKIGTSSAKSLLISHLNYPDKEVQNAVISALNFCRFQASETEHEVIMEKLRKTVGRILWILICIDDVESQKYTLKLVQSLELERDNNFELLFSLLSFLYKPTTIAIIRKNIIGENTIFALELIDNFLEQDVKQLITPIFDSLSLGQRIKKLRQFFPQKRMNFTERLKDIITADYSEIDSWTRAKAIELLGKTHKRKRNKQIKVRRRDELKDIEIWKRETIDEVLEMIRKSEMPDEIFVCLHHSDELIYSTAAKIVYDENPARCYEYLQRLTPEKQKLFDLLENEDSADDGLLSTRIKYLRRNPLFFSIPEYSLAKLAKLFQLKTILKGQKLIIHYLEDSEDIFIVLRGQIQYTDADGEVTIFDKDDFIARGVSLEPEAEELVATKKSLVLIGNRFEYFNTLVDETEIASQMFDMIQDEAEFKA